MQSIDFMGIVLLPNSALSLVSVEELESVEAELGFTFPEDYRNFVITLGSGVTDFSLRVYPPRTILESQMLEVQDRLSEFWFWDKSPDILTQSQAIECVPFFDSPDGDDILFHPSDQSRWFILQHDGDKIIVIHSFQKLCAFYLKRNRKLRPPYKFTVF
ncbi:SMI1/KNR4 family protein [Merismopedia glauca]|uniref:SMI1/KNR4 family protein n=1 Tax=Merismopedia glauca CCAP 1448/3 TaxID=1296344 RepID=A0A2T1BZP2_9CYAN|nr:SMI1/KNR4 family protein [Merismopedia glauca]PSB01387.1 SMI1/KNR4 family protein [Merismopedia glauca CCAP 1448/3]